MPENLAQSFFLQLISAVVSSQSLFASSFSNGTFNKKQSDLRDFQDFLFDEKELDFLKYNPILNANPPSSFSYQIGFGN